MSDINFAGYIDDTGKRFVGGFQSEGHVGPPGYTPQRGIDYWTEEDVTTMETEIKEAVNTEHGSQFDKIDGVEAGAQVNVIEDIKVNNVSQEITSKSVNISVPTNNNQLTNGAGYVTKTVKDLNYYTKTEDSARKIVLSINSSNYVMKASLQTSSGTEISSSSIDLPLESMVVDAAYDSATKEIVLTLQNGNTVRFSVADLVSGLVPDDRTIAGVDLVDDITKNEMLTALNVEDGSQANVLEGVQVDGTDLEITNKKVNITGMATQAEYEQLFDQIPTATATGETINVNDSSNLPLANFELQGNATQNTSIMYYKCVGTETGDYYFVYDSTNYQFSMPTISANEILTFNTSTLKLYQGTTEITTTTASTGTLITLSSTPSPDYPQAIHVVTGNNTVKVTGKNLFDKNATPSYVQSGVVKSINANGELVLTYTGTTSANKYQDYLIFRQTNLKGKVIRVKGIWEVSGSNKGRIMLRKNGNSAISSGTSGDIITHTITDDSPVTISVSLYVNYSGTLAQGDKVTFSEIMVTIEDSDLSYEPYVEQSVTLPLGDIELAKIPNTDYKDRIYKDNDKWWLEKNTIKIASYNGETITTDYISTTGGLDTGATIYYGATTPTITEITDTALITALEQVLAMTTYKAKTNIFTITTGDNATTTLEITYYKDLETMFNNLTNAIISLGGNV